MLVQFFAKHQLCNCCGLHGDVAQFIRANRRMITDASNELNETPHKSCISGVSVNADEVNVLSSYIDTSTYTSYDLVLLPDTTYC